jgi:hypothetical protein
MRHEYRRLSVVLYDRHADHTRRRNAPSPERYFEVDDSSLAEYFVLADEHGDDYWSFLQRAQIEFVDYLNSLGGEGWQVLYYAQAGGIRTGGSRPQDWPSGVHVLTRKYE